MIVESQEWRAEIHAIFTRSQVYQKLEEKLKGNNAAADVLSMIADICFDAYNRTKLVIKHMDQYTLHDGEHLARVLFLMHKIIPKETLDELSVPELMLLILTAFCHDIGMAPSEMEVITWNKIWDTTSPTENTEAYNSFRKFSFGFPDINDQISELIENGSYTEATLLKKHLISEYIRATHADRARKIINTEWNGKIKYKDTDLTAEFAQLCFSHNSEATSLLEMDASLLVGEEVYACLPFVGVILRLSDILDFDAKRTPQVLFSHLAIRNPVSLREWQKHRSIDAWDISNTIIRFSAKCEHPAIESAIYQFCDIIDQELSTSNVVLNKISDSIRNPFPAFYKISLPIKVDRSKIGPKKSPSDGKPIYNYHHTQFNLNKNQVIELLMGTKLYGNPEVALRELIQNSIDACMLREAMERSWNNLAYVPSVEVKFYRDNNLDFLEVNDNGTGMDLEIINKFYSKVGTSFYKSTEFFELRSLIEIKYTPISRFGIGILSCFMVSDVLEVNTRRLLGNYKSGEAFEIIVEGYESIYYIKEGKLDAPGTRTKLILRKNHPWENISPDGILKSIKKLVPHPPFPLKLNIQDRSEVHTGEEFKNIDVRLLHEGTLNLEAGMREVSLTIDEPIFGISGKAVVILLEKDENPVATLNYLTKEIQIEGISLQLTKSFSMRENVIYRESMNIEPDDKGNLRNSQSTYAYFSSKGLIALHGIEIPMNPFPDYFAGRSQKTQLRWPIPILFIVNIYGQKDLDVNSARTEILYTGKWIEFEEAFAYSILNGILQATGEKYMNGLIEILSPNAYSIQFKNALGRLKQELA